MSDCRIVLPPGAGLKLNYQSLDAWDLVGLELILLNSSIMAFCGGLGKSWLIKRFSGVEPPKNNFDSLGRGGHSGENDTSPPKVEILTHHSPFRRNAEY